MPEWIPNPIWQGQDSFIIGGGSSLADFDFKRLKGRNTIGCNDAFRLGPEVVQFCFFGDASFFHRARFELEGSKVRMATCAPSLMCVRLPWLLQVNRMKDGLHTGTVIGWNYSTGAAAINLAMALGSTRIYLLGFDMTWRPADGASHWHKHNLLPTKAHTFQRHLRGFAKVHAELARFPEVHVLNVTNGFSQLPHFTRVTMDAFCTHVAPLPERSVYDEHRRAA